MVLAMLVELYTAILHSDMGKDLPMLMPIIVPMAMVDTPMDLPMAMDTGVDISMEKGQLIQMLSLILVVMDMLMVSLEDIPMFPDHLLMDTDTDVNNATPSERPMMKF